MPIPVTSDVSLKQSGEEGWGKDKGRVGGERQKIEKIK